MTIQSAHFHRIMKQVFSHNLLPVSFSSSFGKRQRVLEFYAYGVLKEKITHKIVQSFTICDPCFFTEFRDACMAAREDIFDELLKPYISPKCERGKYVSMIIAECNLVVQTCSPSNKNILNSLQQFLVNCLFVSGCNNYFNSKFVVASPDRDFKRSQSPVVWNYHLEQMFA
ncbi:hypothetical protein EDI_065060 [Entamoeba dispar SAW760]|uniref:Uncharacterized protein n=1 Tax=Entamoeba dispar (strain ATCC PRA-260 / SAW760) TaxID=370354 RepID=B0EDM0_ENTDS|nr:uncharacterized protein EDI_065060 [Entamoeba dispar SAW760]EDR27383.1 hypothetical protein EDI_065060 [Entamoeba dispar SAW760]|eukprot:EDR27383.1 hypothetical protein EDI_065060 [Entamoeba dispar SAW760]